MPPPKLVLGGGSINGQVYYLAIGRNTLLKTFHINIADGIEVVKLDC
jgi:hypothetical protein